LKGRWRILKAGIRIHGLDAADMIWKTCCALHNYLLEIDGLDEKWESGVPSDWEGEMGQHDDDDIDRIYALRRLNNPTEARAYDSSGIGAGEDHVLNQVAHSNEDGQTLVNYVDGCICVRSLSFDHFRMKLVTHLDIAFKKGEVKWPGRKRD
jgi:hypothetical protein